MTENPQESGPAPKPQAEVYPSLEVDLTKIGVLKDGELNREWFEESLRLSARAITFGKVADSELDRILRVLADDDDTD